MDEEDFLFDLGFEQEEIDELVNFTFNKQDKIAKKKLFNEPAKPSITQIIADKIEKKRLEGRCEKCGSIKQQESRALNESGSKFTMVCMTCKRNRRRERDEIKRAKRKR